MSVSQLQSNQFSQQSSGSGGFMPPPVTKLSETGLSQLWLQDLALKILYFQGYLTGFKIAEEDLRLRGPGEFFGIRQSGILNFSCTDLNKDQGILLSARKAAFKIIEEDPHLRKSENELIKNEFLNNYKDALYLMKVA